MSPFAAGCAICGTDLEAARADLAARRAWRHRLPTLPGVSDDGVRVGLTFLLVLAFPLFGLLLAAYFANAADRDSTRYAMFFLAGLSVLLLVLPVGLWGGIFGRL